METSWAWCLAAALTVAVIWPRRISIFYFLFRVPIHIFLCFEAGRNYYSVVAPANVAANVAVYFGNELWIVEARVLPWPGGSLFYVAGLWWLGHWLLSCAGS